MAARQSKSQKETVERVMHEFKEGELRIGGKGPKVKNPKQAIAIALSEAGASRKDGAKPAGKSKSSRAKSVGAPRTRAQLYEEAQRRGIPGRSRMKKVELERALSR